MAAILIVEENRDLAWFEAGILREAGHTTILAADARSALLKAADGPDLILLDLGLPDLSGEEVLRRLKSRPETAHIPVLVITGANRSSRYQTTRRTFGDGATGSPPRRRRSYIEEKLAWTRNTSRPSGTFSPLS